MQQELTAKLSSLNLFFPQCPDFFTAPTSNFQARGLAVLVANKAQCIWSGRNNSKLRVLILPKGVPQPHPKTDLEKKRLGLKQLKGFPMFCMHRNVLAAAAEAIDRRLKQHAPHSMVESTHSATLNRRWNCPLSSEQRYSIYRFSSTQVEGTVCASKLIKIGQGYTTGHGPDETNDISSSGVGKKAAMRVEKEAALRYYDKVRQVVQPSEMTHCDPKYLQL